MRRSHTSGSGYYDRSLLEDPTERSLRPNTPSEYSEVDPESMVPSEGGPTMTLGDFLGSEPRDYESVLSNNRRSGSVGYNSNTPGVYRTWSGGRDFSLDDSNINNNRPDPSRQHSSNTHTGIGNQPVPPTLIPREQPNLSTANRTHKDDLWHPINITR